MSDTPSSDVITEGIRVQAAAQFAPDHSDPGQRLFQYVYRIVLTNEGEVPAKLRSRHWVILDELNLAPSEVLEALKRLGYAE